MTMPLAGRLKRQIELSGPVSVADYFAQCLFDPLHGYYTTRQPFGRGGDFITAPEISQMFGELVAVWVVSAWRSAGEPDEMVFAEIGPGRGTLMADMLRTIRRIAPGLLAASRIHMIETSPQLAAAQRQALGGESDHVNWIETLGEAPPLPIFLVGNELFDALPVRQFVKTAGGWHERMVDLDADGELSFATGPGTPDAALLPDGAKKQSDGTVFEIAPAREALAANVAERIVRDGGAALFFDYGHLQPGFGDTLQAVRKHRFEHVLANPGEADLTSHVDFSALATTVRAAGADAAFLTQGEFLLRMGLLERAGHLGAAAKTELRHQIEADVERLAGPQGMGELFKAMAIFPNGATPEPFTSSSSV